MVKNQCIGLLFLIFGIIACQGRLVNFSVPLTSSNFAEQNALFGRTVTPIDPISGPSIQVKSGHFYKNNDRFRCIGVNLCFSALAPEHDTADALAERLSWLGVNCVRFHHTESAWYPRGFLNYNSTTINTSFLDKVHYLIHKLAEKGIYTNMNLHVGASFSRILGLPYADELDSHDKRVDLFVPEIIAAQKDYAEALLCAQNPYRPNNASMLEDAAVSFLEISNEDSLFMWDSSSADSRVEQLPDYYYNILKEQYNTALLAEYGSTDNLKAHWASVQSCGVYTSGNLISDPDLQEDISSYTDWHLQTYSPAVATGSLQNDGSPYRRFTVSAIDDTAWHVQTFTRVPLRAAMIYTFSITARAGAADTQIHISSKLNESPWTSGDLRKTIYLTTSWTTYTMSFTSKLNSTNSRVGIAFGYKTGVIDIRDVSLREGSEGGVQSGERIEDGTLELKNQEEECVVRQLSRWKFLANVERKYYSSFKTFLKTELGYTGIVTGTAISSPLTWYGQSDMDYHDTHAYFHHPVWNYGPSWSSTGWSVARSPMVDSATGGAFMPARIRGMPRVVSEYNHPAPNDYQNEAVPMIFSYAAAHDFDGIYIFAYSHSLSALSTPAHLSFFDIANHPGKLLFLRAMALLYGDGLIDPLAEELHYNMTQPLFSSVANMVGVENLDPLEILCANSITLPGSSPSRIPGKLLATRTGVADLHRRRLSVTLTPTAPPPAGAAASSTQFQYFQNEAGEGYYAVASSGGWVSCGRNTVYANTTSYTQGRTLPAVSLANTDHACFSLAPLITPHSPSASATQLSDSSDFLLVALSRVQAVGMVYGYERQNVSNWGTNVTQILPVQATLTLPLSFIPPMKSWEIYPLAGDGGYDATATAQSTVGEESGNLVVTLSPEDETAWFYLKGTPLPSSSSSSAGHSTDPGSESAAAGRRAMHVLALVFSVGTLLVSLLGF